MTRQLERFLTALTRLQMRRERALVERPDHVGRFVVQALLRFAVVLAAWFTYMFSDSLAVHGLLGFAIGGYIGATGLNGLNRARAYRDGWLDGRRAMVGSMSEAQQRGLSMYEWLEREAERDLATLGVHVRLPDSHDDDEGTAGV